MAEEQIQEIKQLIIRDESGRIMDVGLMNGKCYTKSIERGKVWILHRESGRVLPLEPEHSLVNIRDMNRWFEAVVSPVEASETEGTAIPTAGDNDESELGREFSGVPAAERRGMPTETPRRLVSEADAPGGAPDNFLEELESLVRARYAAMPEGSYTTHLFASGGEKIRKKTGEEAVELILAGSPEEMIYEAADLIYHLCVLLVSEGLSFRQVFSLLKERHSTG